ncbi:MAG: GntR family transcriptional regulator [Clostridia bacterium]|nr:GntR family transcriptional regulator [Clostridia bacterium]
MFKYNIRQDSDIPIYKQLVDQINAQIRSGVLKTGDQLPTVREMAEQLNLSCGTVKRVYDRLQEMGDIEMTRRRGTFVKYVRQDRDSRKIQAMAAIDRMIRQLTDLNFSPAEINIFVSLKMREWGLKWSGIRISVVTEYTDMAAFIERQLENIGNAAAVVWSARQVRDYPYNLDEQSDVILASPENARWLENVLPDRSKLIRVAFCMEKECLMALAGASGRIGVLSSEDITLELVREYLPAGENEVILLKDGNESMAEGFDWLVKPEGLMEETASADERHPGIIALRYGIDEGSMIYLEERIARIREERQTHPAGMDLWGEGEEMKKLSHLRREPV